MNVRILLPVVSAFGLLADALAGNPPPSPHRPMVFLLLGQSNMVGFGGRVSELPEGERSLPANCRLILKGRDANFAEEKFCGPEWGLARQLAAEFPGREITLFKWAVSGTSTMAWAPGADAAALKNAISPSDRQAGPLYSRMLGVWKLTFPPTTKPDAILWMQGETDARYPELAPGFAGRMEKIITSLRIDLNCPGAPFLMGQINPEKERNFAFVDEVRAAQEFLASKLPGVHLVPTGGLEKNPDAVHYNTAGQQELGRRFARVFLKTAPNHEGDKKP